MPFVRVNQTRLFYRLEGQEGHPVLVLSHSIGTDHSMWEPQMPELLSRFQVLRYDTRGHGASDAPAGEYTVEDLGRDFVGLADALNIRTFAFCGLSLGGAIGQWVASHTPARISHLVLANSSPQFAPRSNWENRIKSIGDAGMKAIVEVAMGRFFSPETLAANPHAASIRNVFLGTDPKGYIGCCAALRDFDGIGWLGEIHVPTLVIAGDHDVSTPWAGHAELLAKGIPGARVVHLPAAHLSNIARPHSFTAALMDFLLPKPAGDTLEAGFEVRRAGLGTAHVNRSLAAATDFNREFQELITRYAWGAIWTRPGLSHRTRRLLALAMMAALGRWEEFELHLRAGLERELEPCDVKELLLQTAIYAGVPAANTGFRIAQQFVHRAAESEERKE